MTTLAAPYLMEDPREAQRLAAKVDARDWVQDFLARHCAFASHALDVGCGPGTITAELAKRFPRTQVVGLDASPSRLAEAERRFVGLNNASIKQGDAASLPFPEDSFDLVYCRFLLEYLSAPAQPIAEMVRVCKPGGTVLLQDLDGQLVWHYPVDSKLEAHISQVLMALAQQGFDPYMGRKLFHLAQNANLSEVKVQIAPYHLIAGVPSDHELALWQLKLDIAVPVLARVVGGTAAAKDIKSRFLDYLNREDTLTYSVLFTVTGKKPIGQPHVTALSNQSSTCDPH